MQFGGFEPRTVTARKLNDLVKMVEDLQAEVAALKQQEEKPVKKASAKKTEEKSEATE